MSSCSSSPVSSSRWRRSVTLQPLAFLRRVDQHAGEGDEAGEALGADRRLAAPVAARARRRLAQRPLDRLGRFEVAAVAVVEQVEPLAGFLAQLLGLQHLGVLAPAQHPGDQLARRGVVRLEDRALAGRVVGLARRAQLAVAAEVALDQPGDPVADEDLRRAADLAELPVGALAVVAAVEVLGRGEVVLGLGGVADLALDAGEAEDADRVALVRVADQVELAGAEDEVEGVDLALLGLVALHRVVGELDRLAARDRGLDLGQPLREVAAPGRRRHRHLDRRPVALADRVRMAPGDLLQGEAQRLGVGEAAVGEQRERRAQRGQLVVRELDRVEVEVLRRQRVELGLEEALARFLHPELDAEALQLGAVGVEAAREGVVVHVAVALDLALDLQRRDRPALRHQEGDQRELADQLLGVLCHEPRIVRAAWRAPRPGRRKPAFWPIRAG